VTSADEAKIYRLGGRNRRWPVWAFGVLFGGQFISAVLNAVRPAQTGRWGNVVIGSVFAAYWLALALGFARMRVTTSAEGVTVLQPSSIHRSFPWEQVTGFSIRGEVSPTGYINLKGRRPIRTAVLSDGWNIRRKPPSEELRAIIANLEADRQRWTAVPVAD